MYYGSPPAPECSPGIAAPRALQLHRAPENRRPAISSAPLSRSRPAGAQGRPATLSLARSLGVARAALDETPLRAALLVGLVVVAYAYTYASLVRAATIGATAGLLVIVPVVALLLAWARLRREPPALPIHDRQVDYIVALALILGAIALGVLLPQSRGSQFWLARMDLLGPPLFAGGLVAMFYGVRRAWSLRWALAALVLAWPGLWEPLLDDRGAPALLAVVGAMLAIGVALTFRDRRPVRPAVNPVRRLGWAPVVATIAAAALGLVNVGYARYGALVDEAGNPTRTPFTMEPAAVAGWQLADPAPGEDDTSDVPRPFLHEGVELKRSLLVPAGGPDDATPVVLDVLSAPQTDPVTADDVDAGYGLPRDETITRRSVDIGAGVAAELRTFVNERLGTTRAVIAWDWPVRAGDGVRHERIVLVVPDVTNARSSSASVSSAVAPGPAHADAERLLVELARQLVHDTAPATVATAESGQ